MVVDVHTHFFNPQTVFADRLKADMVQSGINPENWAFTPQQFEEGIEAADVAVVFGIETEATGWQGDNETVFNYTRQHSDRLIFFASIDPGRDGYMDEMIRCHQDWGCQGIKLGPIYQGVHPLDSRYYDIYRYCSEHQLPIMTHMATTFTSGVPLEYARPVHMDQVAVDFPDLKIFLHTWVTLGKEKQSQSYAGIKMSSLIYLPSTIVLGNTTIQCGYWWNTVLIKKYSSAQIFQPLQPAKLSMVCEILTSLQAQYRYLLFRVRLSNRLFIEMH